MKRLHRGIAVCIMGNDGSGKTTLSSGIAEEMARKGIAHQRKHIYRWFHHLTSVPLMILWNRYISRQVLIFDRSIFDTLAVFFARHPGARCLLPVMSAILRWIYPGFRPRFYLQISFEESLRRRPGETDQQGYEAIIPCYQYLASRQRFSCYETHVPVLDQVLEEVYAEVSV